MAHWHQQHGPPDDKPQTIEIQLYQGQNGELSFKGRLSCSSPLPELFILSFLFSQCQKKASSSLRAVVVNLVNKTKNIHQFATSPPPQSTTNNPRYPSPYGGLELGSWRWGFQPSGHGCGSVDRQGQGWAAPRRARAPVPLRIREFSTLLLVRSAPRVFLAALLARAAARALPAGALGC